MKKISNTILDKLEEQACLQPNREAFIFLADGEIEQCNITYQQLVDQAKQFALYLQQYAIPKDRILLTFLPGLDFIVAFLGCLYAKFIAVPAYPLRSNYHANRFLTMISDCKPALICGTEKSLDLMRKHPGFSSYQYALFDTSRTIGNDNFQSLGINQQDIAFLQYTSGSTGSPKGVAITHDNIISNQLALDKYFALSPEDTAVSWLPMQHDMGLIGGILHSIYGGVRSIILPPTTFLEKPIRWLNVISNYRAYASGGPNFAYQLCIDKISQDEIQHLDLSCWTRAYNGSEPIRASTLSDFVKKFSACGFEARSFLCCYGMAETTLLVSGSEKGLDPSLSLMAKENEYASSGSIHDSYVVKIVDPSSGTLVSDRQIGEIWVQGPCVAQGYWQQPKLTQQIFHAKLPNDERDYLRTGDLGYLNSGELYVTGRLKDLIIIEGRNIYPQDIEYIVETCHPAIKSFSTAVFSIDVERQERVIIVAEVNRSYRKMDFSPLFQLIRQQVLQIAELVPYSIQLLSPGHALRTTSGKIQRQATRQKYLDETLEVLAKDDLFAKSVHQIPSLEALNQQIIDLVSKMLGTDEVKNINGATSLFSLGLGSLALNEIKLNLEQQLNNYGIKIPIEIFYQDLELAELSQFIVDKLMVANRQKIILSPAFHAERTVPLAYTQLVYWLDKKIAARSLSFRVRLLGALDINRLEWAINQMLTRHMVFWYKIYAIKPMQTVGETSWFKLPVLTEQSCKAPFNQESAKKFFRKTMLIPFKFDKLPLFKAYLIKISHNEFDFAIFVPHIIADGGSVDIFYRELKHFYFSNDPFSPLSSSYIDNIFWEREIVAINCKEKYHFWEKYIGKQGTYNIPANLLTTKAQLEAGNLHSFIISEEINQAFSKFCRNHAINVELGYLLVLRVMLYFINHQQALVIAYLRSGRYDKRLENLIGNFITVDLYKLKSSDTLTFDDLVSEFKKEILYLAPYQDGNFISKFFPLMKQTFLFRKASFALSNLVKPLFYLYFKLYKVDFLITQMIAQFAMEDLLATIYKIFIKNSKPLKKCMVFFNILPSYYQTTSYDFGNIIIDDHSYLETMNINLGEDSLFFYLGRKVDLSLVLSINGAIHLAGQQEMHRCFIALIQALIEGPNKTIKELIKHNKAADG